jgi:DNA-binding CsgD family transcriptional regulator
MDEAIEDITGIPANEFQDKTPLETLGEITEVSHLEGINEFVNKSIEKHLSPDEKNPITINLVYNIVTRRQEKKRLHVRYIFSEFEGNTPTFTKGVATDITHIQKDGMPVFFIVKNNRVIYREVGQPEILLRKSSIPLSRTELNILRLTSKGFSAKEISVLMKISLSTLYTHRKNIKAKMGKDINFVISMLRGKGFIS